MTHHEKISTRKTDLQRGALVDTRKPILLTKNKFQPKKKTDLQRGAVVAREPVLYITLLTKKI